MNQRSAVFVAIMGIFFATLLASILVIYAPKGSRIKPVPLPEIATTIQTTIYALTTDRGPHQSTVMTTPIPATTAPVSVVSPSRPPALRIVAAMVILSVLWALRATGLLYPLLAILATVSFVVLPASHYIASGRPSCGLQAVCDLTEFARSQLQMQFDISGFPDVYVKLLSGLLSNLERLNCRRTEDNCPELSLPTVMPFL